MNTKKVDYTRIINYSQVFKKQYVSHASKKLRLIVDLTSANCSHQVQQLVFFFKYEPENEVALAQ